MKEKINPKLKVGDRIILVHMDDEFSPVSPGSRGTVKNVHKMGWDDSTTYGVEWDNGRTLNLLSDVDFWIKETDFKKPLKESRIDFDTNLCGVFNEGQIFCNNLLRILDKGSGGTGTRTLKAQSIEFFKNLLQGEYGGIGKKITLKPGVEQFEERFEQLVHLKRILTQHNACKKMIGGIDEEIIKVKSDESKMVVDDEEKYSILNRIDTHYSVRAYILTKAVLTIYDNFNRTPLDMLETPEIIDLMSKEVLRYGKNKKFDKWAYDFIDEVIKNSLDNELERDMILTNLEYSKSSGDRTEGEVKNLLLANKNIEEVYDYTKDFGFVDKFGVDLVVITKSGALHPVQISSSRKPNPAFYKYNDSDCECWAIYKTSNGFRKETLFSEQKN